MKIQFGVRLPVSGPLAYAPNILRIGQAADELGFDALTTHDHVTNSYTERYHNAGGMAELVEEQDKKGIPVTNFYETVTTLSVLAGKTKHVRLVPCAIVLPLRHPVLLAKQLVTTHELSGGRFVCCVAIGRIKGAYASMNVNYKIRGKMMDEYLDVLKMAFSPEPRVSFQGKYVSFPPTEFFPKPSTELPLWIAGYLNEVAYERVAKYGTGFLPNSFPDALREGLPRLRETLKEHGRDPESVLVGTQTFMCVMKDGEEARRRPQYTVKSFFHGPEWDSPDPNIPGKTMRDTMMEGIMKNALVGSPDDVIRRLEDYIDAGVRFFDIRQVNKGPDEVVEQLKLFSKEVMPSFR